MQTGDEYRTKAAERQRAYALRKKQKGYTRVAYWVPNDDSVLDRIHNYISRVRSEYEGGS